MPLRGGSGISPDEISSNRAGSKIMAAMPPMLAYTIESSAMSGYGPALIVGQGRFDRLFVELAK
jgi:hypothetical protein